MFESSRWRLTLHVLLFGLIAVVLALGAFGSYYVYQKVRASLTGQVIDQARTIAVSLDAEDFAALAGSENDIYHPAYQRLKEKMMELRTVNHDARFVYLMGYNGEVPYFIVDSEPADSEDYSPPGQTYEEASDELIRSFTKGESGYEIAEDRWGVWLSGYAPIVNRQTGAIAAVAGIDVDWYSKYLPTLIAYTVLPTAAAIMVVLVLWVTLLIRRREELRLAERVESLSIASHEIRTPLTGITWAAESLIKHPENLTADAKEKLIAIYQSSQETLERVGNFLMLNVLAHKKYAELSPLELRTLIEDMAISYHLAAEARGITLFIDPTHTTPANVRGDASRLKLMINNLVSNAVKYSNPNTTITIRLSEEDDWYAISIENTGIGIPKEELPHIFEGYHRTKEAEKNAPGNGLGLHLVAEIAHLHGGDVHAQSDENGRTIFTVRLPKAK